METFNRTSGGIKGYRDRLFISYFAREWQSFCTQVFDLSFPDGSVYFVEHFFTVFGTAGMKPFHRIARIAVFFLFAGIILWGSLDAHPPVPQWSFLAWDKAQHTLAYGVLTLLAGGALAVFVRSMAATWILAFLLSLSYGIILEYLQKYMTRTRSFEINDMVADGLGSLCCAIAGFAWYRFIVRDRKEQRS